MLQYRRLSERPAVFPSMTGRRVGEFAALVRDVLPTYAAAERTRPSYPGRRRAMGAGRRLRWEPRDQVRLTVGWRRQYRTYPVLGYLCGGLSAPPSRDCSIGCCRYWRTMGGCTCVRPTAPIAPGEDWMRGWPTPPRWRW